MCSRGAITAQLAQRARAVTRAEAMLAERELQLAEACRAAAWLGGWDVRTIADAAQLPRRIVKRYVRHQPR